MEKAHCQPRGDPPSLNLRLRLELVAGSWVRRQRSFAKHPLRTCGHLMLPGCGQPLSHRPQCRTLGYSVPRNALVLVPKRKTFQTVRVFCGIPVKGNLLQLKAACDCLSRRSDSYGPPPALEPPLKWLKQRQRPQARARFICIDPSLQELPPAVALDQRFARCLIFFNLPL